MAPHAALLAEKVFAIVNDFPFCTAASQHHVGGMAGLAPSLHGLFREKGPQPVLVISVGLLDAGGGASVALMARRTAKLFRIMDLQKFRLGMAHESLGVLIRLLLALRHHHRG